MKVNVDFPRDFVEGKYQIITLTVDSNLTNYNAKCVIYDRSGTDLKLATAGVSGGANTQIAISAGAISTITIYVQNDATLNFKSECYIEVDLVDSNNNEIPLYYDRFYLQSTEIDWDSI
jgi:hypothetical protein